MACLAASKAPFGLLLFAAGRVVGGFGAGAATVLVPLYLGRIAPLKLRGAIGNLHQASKDSRNSVARFAIGFVFNAFHIRKPGMIWTDMERELHCLEGLRNERLDSTAWTSWWESLVKVETSTDIVISSTTFPGGDCVGTPGRPVRRRMWC